MGQKLIEGDVHFPFSSSARRPNGVQKGVRKDFRKIHGVVLTDFIFAFVIFGGMSVVMFALAYSLFVVEVSQYVAYSTSRAHLAGSESAQAQMQSAIAKYQSFLDGQGAIGRIFKSSWFEIEQPQNILIRQGGGLQESATFNQEFGNAASQQRGKFIGVSIKLAFHILKINLPSLGGTQSEESDNSPTSYLNAFMIREPSQRECLDFFQERSNNRNLWRNLLADPDFSMGNAQTFGFAGDDNGC